MKLDTADEHRRVGVTARSRRTGTSQATGVSQVATEMAAPLCIENTNGHRGEGRKQSADGSMATMAISRMSQNHATSNTARCARMRRRLKLRQGASPLRPPAPFPSGVDCRQGSESVKGSLRRHLSPPLTDSLPCRPINNYEGKGATGRPPILASRWSAPGSFDCRTLNGALRAHEALPHTPPGGQAPLRPRAREIFS